MLNLIRRLKWFHRKLHLDSSLPFITLVSYTLVGAALFRALELDKDRSEREHFRKAFKFALNHTALNILAINSVNQIDPNDEKSRKIIEKAVSEIQWLLNYLNLTQAISEKSEATPWSWYGSMFYAGQLYTTIGYGLPVAKTRAGQVASIFYILAGIPIFLIILKNVGKIFSRFFRKLYKRIGSARSKLPQNPYLKKMTVPMKKHPNDVGKLENGQIAKLNDRRESRSKGDTFPIPIAFAILILWIFFSAALFCLWERQWGFMTSVYFFFVSISTVGLGDIIPSNKDMMLANFVLILFGLALLSMCFNVIQITVERMLDQFLQQCFEEIEKVAALINKQGDIEGDGLCPPRFEERSWNFTDLIKEWIASQLVNKIISSKLEMHSYDSDSDDELDSQLNPKESMIREEVKLLRRGHWMTLKMKQNPNFLKALGVLKKFKGIHDKNHFKSVLFFKFVTNERLERILSTCDHDDDTVKYTESDMASSGDKTPDSDLSDSNYLERDMRVGKLTDSMSTFDIESIDSKAYNDIQFGDSYASFWTNPENNSEIFLHSEASLDLTYDDNIERRNTGVSIISLQNIPSEIFDGIQNPTNQTNDNEKSDNQNS